MGDNGLGVNRRSGKKEEVCWQTLHLATSGWDDRSLYRKCLFLAFGLKIPCPPGPCTGSPRPRQELLLCDKWSIIHNTLASVPRRQRLWEALMSGTPVKGDGGIG